ncbi:MAG: leucine-rich repeat protein [Clostridia bacterium]|nr:leucine-rich repeat protein [Clostridia bacterium]
MKKKILFVMLIMLAFMLTFVITALAKDVNIGITDIDGNDIIVPTVDDEGDSLTWYRITDEPSEGTYYTYLSGNTTYYLVSVKTKIAAYVNDNYRVCYSYSGLKAGAWSGNIVVMNLKGLTHTDGKGPELLNFICEGTPIAYAYLPASITELKGTSGNKIASIFYGCGSLVGLDIEEGSQIKTLYTNGLYNCKKLTSFRLPDNLETIQANALVGLTVSITVPKSVTTFEASQWSNLTVTYTGTATDISSWTYQPSSITYANHCDVYYDSNHQIGEAIGYETFCAKCGSIVYCENPAHNLEVSITYDSYLANGMKKTRCLDCDSEAKEVVASPLFTFRGFSAAEYADGGMSIGFNVNNEAISEYEQITGKTINYGVFAVLKDKIGDSDIFDGDGNAALGVIAADITDCGFNILNLKIVGFTSEQTYVKLAMGAYAKVTQNGTAEYTYMQGENPENGDKYFFASYNDIAAIVKSKEEAAQ